MQEPMAMSLTGTRPCVHRRGRLSGTGPAGVPPVVCGTSGKGPHRQSAAAGRRHGYRAQQRQLSSSSGLPAGVPGRDGVSHQLPVAGRRARRVQTAASAVPSPSQGQGTGGRSDAVTRPAAATLEAPLAKTTSTSGDDAAPLSPGSLLATPLQEHPLLRRGTLPNGLRYCVLPNGVPSGRFEAHLEMHVGSVDEREDEQGLAHLVEHVTFLGSPKRDRLLGAFGLLIVESRRRKR